MTVAGRSPACLDFEVIPLHSTYAPTKGGGGNCNGTIVSSIGQRSCIMPGWSIRTVARRRHWFFGCISSFDFEVELEMKKAGK